MAEAYLILSQDGPNTPEVKARAQILGLLLTSQYRPTTGGSYVLLPDIPGLENTFPHTGAGAIGYILALYDADMFNAAHALAGGMNEAPAGVDWTTYWENMGYSMSMTTSSEVLVAARYEYLIPGVVSIEITLDMGTEGVASFPLVLSMTGGFTTE